MEARIAADYGTVSITTIGNSERASLVALGLPVENAEYLQSKTTVGNFVVSLELYAALQAPKIGEVRPLAIRRRSSWFMEALTRYETGINYLLKNYN